MLWEVAEANFDKEVIYCDKQGKSKARTRKDLGSNLALIAFGVRCKASPRTAITRRVHLAMRHTVRRGTLNMLIVRILERTISSY